MTNESNPNSQPAHHPGTAPDQKPISPRLALLGVAVLLIVALLLAGYGIQDVGDIIRHAAAAVVRQPRRDHARAVASDHRTMIVPWFIFMPHS